jgi:8-oxo-dGTP diphosphatase
MHVVDVAAGLVFRKGRLLITQRPAGVHLAGLWEFPGGKREPGESFEECLVRELREELAMDVAVEHLVEDITHTYSEKTVRICFYRCCWLRHEPQTIECADLKWVCASEMKNYPFPPADARLLQKLIDTPVLWGDAD